MHEFVQSNECEASARQDAEALRAFVYELRTEAHVEAHEHAGTPRADEANERLHRCHDALVSAAPSAPAVPEATPATDAVALLREARAALDCEGHAFPGGHYCQWCEEVDDNGTIRTKIDAALGGREGR